MKEILAGNMEQFFNNEFNGKCTYKGDEYEVWEVSDESFDVMCDMSEEDFVKLAGKDAWWRYCNGSVIGVPDANYEINGFRIVAWDERRNRYIEDCKKCSIKEMYDCEQTEENCDECFGKRRYKSLTEYLCEEIGASLPKNVCALAVDLAKYNNMTMGELFTKYEG